MHIMKKVSNFKIHLDRISQNVSNVFYKSIKRKSIHRFCSDSQKMWLKVYFRNGVKIIEIHSLEFAHRPAKQNTRLF